MKICSLCNRTYDDRVDFCFAEGEPLAFAPARTGGEPRPAGKKVSTLVPVESTSAPVAPTKVRENAPLGADPTIIPEDDEDLGPVYLPEETAPVPPAPAAPPAEAPRRPTTLTDELEIAERARTPIPEVVDGEQLEGPAPIEFPRAQPGRVPASQRPGFRPTTREALLPHEDDVAPPPAPANSAPPPEEEEEHGPYWGRIIGAAVILLGLVFGVGKVILGGGEPEVVAGNAPPVEPPPVAQEIVPPVTPPAVENPPPVEVTPPEVVAEVTPPVTPPVAPTTQPVKPANPTTPPNNPAVSVPTGPQNPVTPPKPAVAALRITVSPPEAAISVDGVSAGQGSASWSGAPGRHTVTAKAPGYRSAERAVDLAATGGEVSLTLEKEALSGIVKLFGTPGSQVYVGDKKIDSLPAQIELAEGSYNFRVVLPDQTSYSVQKAIKFASPGQPVNVSLAPN